MRLFLIRHGETVDNVANLYAGSRDSELTNHGFQQASRLGLHFRSTAVNFTHIFSSQLKRAVKTAELISNAQVSRADAASHIEVQQVRLLMEQDFGYYEGKSFAARQNTGTLSGKEAHRAVHKDDPGFVDVESKDSMALRVDAFLDDHLYPIMDSDAPGQEHIVAIVSHGILLSVLWRRLLLRLPPKSASLHPEILAKIGQLDLERLSGWSNTGYLDLEMRRINEPQLAVAPSASTNTNTASSPPKHDAESPATPLLSLAVPTDMGKLLTGWSMTILAVNSKDHLTGLKRTRGGVGSARHDPSQQSISSFFKKQKKENPSSAS